MERQDYPAMLPQLSPTQAVDVLHDRVRQVGKLNTAIADWLQERRKIEEQYASGLRRIARRQLEDVDLGVFSIPWDALTGSADTLADSHAALAIKMEGDVERPLRDFVSTNRDMQAMTTIQGNLSSLAKDVDRAQQKTEKLKGRGDKARAGEVAGANSELEGAQSQWDSQAPYVFETLQALDETRLNHLRDTLTQFQTHEVDQVEKSRTAAEHCLNVILSMQTEDEIKTFAIKAVQGRSRSDRAPRSNAPLIAGAHNAPSASTPSRAPTSSSALTPTMSQPDNSSTRSGSVQEEPTKKSRFGGLKRLGTVMGGGRKRDSRIPPAALAPMAESPEAKSKSSPFNSLSGRLGRNKDSQMLEPPYEASSRDRPRSPLRMGSEVLDVPSRSRTNLSTPAPTQNAEALSQLNGTSSYARDAPPQLAPILNGSHQSHLADLEPPRPSSLQPPPQSAFAEPIRDSEGFSLPPQKIDPITQAQQDAISEGGAPAYNVNIRDAPIQEEGAASEAALASVANKLQAPPSISRRGGTVRGRRADRASAVPSSFVAPAENPDDVISSIPSTGSSAPVVQPQAFSPPPSVQPPAFSPAPIEQPPAISPAAVGQPSPFDSAPIERSRGVVEEPSPIVTALPPSTERAISPTAMSSQSPIGGFVPGAVAASTFSPFASTMSSSSPMRPDSRTANNVDPTGDTQSIRSGRSLTSTGSQGGVKHAELHGTGLNSSIVETVNARFEDGKLVSSTLLGEIALAYNPADFSSPFTTENIRLENFANLEKVAPNPAFITQSPGKQGEYAVNLATLGKTQVAFKYQLKTDDVGTQAPLLITPVLRIEPTQTSIIVNYALHPAFNLHSRESVTVSNVMLALSLEGAQATACLSKPVGTFARERNLIFWQLGDLTLRAGAAPEKLLARFTTETETKGCHVEARWEITGENALNLGSGLAVSVQGQPGTGAGDSADPFADESTAGLVERWKGVQGAKRLASGAYTAK